MLGLDGLALCRALKADAATAAIPFLLASGEVARAMGEDRLKVATVRVLAEITP